MKITVNVELLAAKFTFDMPRFTKTDDISERAFAELLKRLRWNWEVEHGGDPRSRDGQAG